MQIEKDCIFFSGPAYSAQLVLLGHAGGSVTFYLPLARQLSTLCNVVLLELPGKGIREDEPFVHCVPDLMQDLVAAIRRRPLRPLILCGHSLGALLTVHLADALARSGAGDVRAVVLSSAASPTRTVQDRLAQADDRELLRHLEVWGGWPETAPTDKEFMAAALQALRRDLQLAAALASQIPNQFLPPSVELWFGTKDVFVGEDDVHDWGRLLQTNTLTRRFSGGHFFLVNQEDAGHALVRLVERVGSPNGG